MKKTTDQGDTTFELPHEVILKKPVKLGEKNTITKVTFQNELTGEMVGELPTGGKEFYKMKHFYPVISKMTGEHTILVNKMAYCDLESCMEIVTHFLLDGQEDDGLSE